MGKQTTVTIRGIVVAAAWKQNGEILTVDIAGYNEKRYRIADDHMGIQLRALNRKRIVAHGCLEIENNKPVLSVHHFKIDASEAIDASKPEGS